MTYTEELYFYLLDNEHASPIQSLCKSYSIAVSIVTWLRVGQRSVRFPVGAVFISSIMSRLILGSVGPLPNGYQELNS
jgi:hypothetical protein